MTLNIEALVAAPTYMLRYPGGTEQHEFVLASNYAEAIAALREQARGLAEWKQRCKDGLQVAELKHERTELRVALATQAAQIEGLRKDAERYRFFREFKFTPAQIEAECIRRGVINLTSVLLDELIDEAMAGKQAG